MTPEQEKYIANILLKQKLISHEQLSKCVQIQRQKKSSSLLSVFVQNGYVSSSTLTQIIQQTSTSTPRTSVQIQEGRNFVHYQVQEELGRGGMGMVYKVYDTKLQREVALKIISASENVSSKQIARFMLEAKSMARLKHPNIIEVYEVGETPQNYFTMEYIEGRVLANAIRENQILPRQAAKIIWQCALALSECHKNGIVHRDIKPSNIMLNQGDNPKLMDFGLVKILDDDLSKTGEILGTPAYMSPEQIQGQETGPKSDIYSLGTTLYQTLTQRAPFQGSTFVNIACQVTEQDPVAPHVLNPDIPRELEAICLKAMQKIPRNRYLSARALAKDLENFLHNRPVLAKPPSPFVYLKKWILRNKTISIISLTAIILILLSVAIVFSSLQRQAAIEKESAQKAQREKEKAIVAQKKALRARVELEKQKAEIEGQKKKIEKQNELMQKAYAEIAQERDRAILAKKQAQSAVYYSNIILAQKFCDEGDIANVDYTLESTPRELRNWEWFWLRTKAHDEFASITHKAGIECCDISPDGKKIVTTDHHGHMQLWDLKSRRLVYDFFAPKHMGTYCSFGPRGKKIATVGKKQVSIRWADSGKLIHELDHSSEPISSVFSPDGESLLCTYHAETGESVVLWNVRSGKKTMEFSDLSNHSNNDILDADFSPNGKWIVTAGEDFTLVLWDIKTQKIIKRFIGHGDEVQGCCFSPDGRYIASAGSDHKVIIWDVVNKKQWKVLRAHTDKVICCDYSPDGTKILSCGWDKRVILWNAKSGKIIRSFYGHTKKIKKSLFHPDGETIVTCSEDNSVKLWKVKQLPKPLSLDLPKSKIIFICPATNGKTLAFITPISFAVQLWDLSANKKLAPLLVNSAVYSCVFSPDSTKLLTVGNDGAMLFDYKKHKKLLHLKTKNELIGCDYSRQGDRIITSSYGVVYMWDIARRLKKPIAEFRAKNTNIHYCIFNPDGKTIAFTNGFYLYVFDIKSQKQLWKKHIQGRFRSCQFNDDGTLLLCAAGPDLLIFDMRTFNLKTKFTGHTGVVNRALFSKDYKRIISASSDKTIKIWETNAFGKWINNAWVVPSPLLSITAHTKKISCLTILPDGSFVSGSDDGQLKLWSIR